jgi:hypothetical protein
MWADTLLSIERGHLQRLLLWAAISMVAGTAMLAWLAARRERAPLVRHFAIQTAAWGAVNAGIVAWAWRGLVIRDYAGAQRLLNIIWLNTGLDVGYAAVGATMAIVAWKLGPRQGLIGAGLGIIVQGLALALLDLRLIGAIGPLK